MTLTLAKMRLAKFLLTPPSLREMTLKEFAENKLRITEQTLHRWKKDTEVINFIRESIPPNFSGDIPDILETTKMRALAGDMRAARIFFEYVVGPLPKIPTLKQSAKERLTS